MAQLKNYWAVNRPKDITKNAVETQVGDKKERLRKMEERIIKSSIFPVGLEEGRKTERQEPKKYWLVIFQN